MLTYKYRMLMPDPMALKPGQQPAPPRPGQAPPQRKLSKAVSLHPLGRNLRGCLAAAYGPKIFVFETHIGLSAATNISKAR